MRVATVAAYTPPRPLGMLRKLRRQAAARLLTAALLCISQAPIAQAQQTAAMRLGVNFDSASARVGGPGRTAADSTSNRLVNTMHGALIGSGIGAACGLIVALIETHNGVTDHSEDGMGYITFATIGALVGYVVGGVVGFVRN